MSDEKKAPLNTSVYAREQHLAGEELGKHTDLHDAEPLTKVEWFCFKLMTAICAGIISIAKWIEED